MKGFSHEEATRLWCLFMRDTSPRNHKNGHALKHLAAYAGVPVDTLRRHFRELEDRIDGPISFGAFLRHEPRPRPAEKLKLVR